MTTDLPVPDTRILAVASHVVSGNVGNKIAVFAMQSLGCDVAALNTVQFSNHTGYRQWKGTRISAGEITDLFEGLKQSHLDDFDMMLSGYIPGAEAVQAVGRIAAELKEKARPRPGSFFWALDPVMGDGGRLYVAPEVVPAYKALVRFADLILPNQFEAELLSEVKIEDMESLKHAIQVLHDKYRIPHVVITSVSLGQQLQQQQHQHQHQQQSGGGGGGGGDDDDNQPAVASLSVVGSTMTSDGRARLFKIVFPAIDCYFSGTGDLFAALMAVRLREAVHGPGAGGEGPAGRDAWVSDDDVAALDLPLARAAELVLASMHEVLDRTAASMRRFVEGAAEGDAEALHLLKSKAAELKLHRNLESLRHPAVKFRAVLL